MKRVKYSTSSTSPDIALDDELLSQSDFKVGSEMKRQMLMSTSQALAPSTGINKSPTNINAFPSLLGRKDWSRGVKL